RLDLHTRENFPGLLLTFAITRFAEQFCRLDNKVLSGCKIDFSQMQQSIGLPTLISQLLKGEESCLKLSAGSIEIAGIEIKTAKAGANATPVIAGYRRTQGAERQVGSGSWPGDQVGPVFAKFPGRGRSFQRLLLCPPRHLRGSQVFQGLCFPGWGSAPSGRMMRPE